MMRELWVQGIETAANPWGGDCILHNLYNVFLFSIVDTMKPVINNCPTAAIRSTLPAGASVVSVTWTEPTAIDNSQLPVDVSRSNVPGSTFNQGTHTVTYTFSDSVNNQATCTFMVIVGGNKSVSSGH